MTEQVVDAEVVEEPGTDLTPSTEAATNLFRTDDPAEVLRRATETANALMPQVRKSGLVVNIQGRDHLRVEAWTTLGAMLGVTPVCAWTRKLDNGWEARVEAKTLDGRVIGAAEAECLTSERQWANRDDYALRSMAQTRATSKALASVLRFVATLGGASGTPAEEMPAPEKDAGSEREAAPSQSVSPPSGAGSRSDSDPATQKQRQWVLGDGTEKPGLLEKSNFSEEQLAAISAWGTNEQGKLTKKAASFLIEHLKDGTEAGRLEVLNAAMPTSDVPVDEAGL